MRKTLLIVADDHQGHPLALADGAVVEIGRRRMATGHVARAYRICVQDVVESDCVLHT